ncbi:hypothetical protein N9043_00215 [bacterium]|nr:hypothetical protein [bacterium]
MINIPKLAFQVATGVYEIEGKKFLIIASDSTVDPVYSISIVNDGFILNRDRLITYMIDSDGDENLVWNLGIDMLCSTTTNPIYEDNISVQIYCCSSGTREVYGGKQQTVMKVFKALGKGCFEQHLEAGRKAIERSALLASID